MIHVQTRYQTLDPIGVEFRKSWRYAHIIPR
jgi:hypothetical protein